MGSTISWPASTFDLGTSVLTLLIFIVPVVVYRLKGRTPQT
ncbi:hypothetical protein [Luteolibacter sp. Populi]